MRKSWTERELSKIRRRHRSNIGIWVTISVFITCLILFSWKMTTKAKNKETKPTINQEANLDKQFHQEVGMIESILMETEHMMYSLHYPKFHQSDIDLDIYQLIKKTVNRLEASFEDGIMENEHSMLYMNYDSYLLGDNLVSIVCYFEIAAENESYKKNVVVSRCYDLITGKTLSVEELLQGDYLDVIAKYCKNYFETSEIYAELMNSSDAKDALLPKKKNFSNISFTSTGLMVTLTEKQLDFLPKRCQITIPYEVMKPYLNFDESKETIVVEEKEEPPTEQEQTETSNQLTIDGEKPMVALTFDDGPNPKVTNRILDVLSKYDSRATFFVVGNRLKDYNDTLKRIVNEKSEIGSHTYDHKSLSLLSKSEIKRELSLVDDYLYELLGIRDITLRPPYGAANDMVSSTVNKPMIYWSVDTEDWKSRNTNAIIDHVMSNVKDGDIILFHDLYETTAAAIEVIVPKLIEEGYQIVTVSEMFEAKGIELKNGMKYYNAR